jgi:hypothetical protein
MKVLFIGGAGRSGSTLLELVTGNVPGWFSVGEVRFFWEYANEPRARLCGCGEELVACPFWAEVIGVLGPGFGESRFAELSELARRFDRTRRSLPRPGAARRSPQYARLVSATASLYAAVARVSGADVVVDSSKIPTHLGLLLDAGLDVLVLHLVRDGRAVAYSWHRRLKRELSLPAGRMKRVGLVRALLTWALENQLVSRIGRRASGYRVLRYEDFVSAPSATIRAALEGLDLEVPDFEWLTEPEVRLEPTHSVGGNPARFRSGPLRIHEDLEWRSELGRGRRLALGLMALPMLSRYGYRL